MMNRRTEINRSVRLLKHNINRISFRRGQNKLKQGNRFGVIFYSMCRIDTGTFIYNSSLYIHISISFKFPWKYHINFHLKDKKN